MLYSVNSKEASTGTGNKLGITRPIVLLHAHFHDFNEIVMFLLHNCFMHCFKNDISSLNVYKNKKDVLLRKDIQFCVFRTVQ